MYVGIIRQRMNRYYYRTGVIFVYEIIIVKIQNHNRVSLTMYHSTGHLY